MRQRRSTARSALSRRVCLLTGISLTLIVILTQVSFQKAPSGWVPTQPVGEEVTFSRGADTIHGSLLLPAGAGPHPAVVMVEGSGPASYRTHWHQAGFSFWRELSELFLRQGVAVLLFDKPGINRSTGDWRKESFQDRAENVLAAVRFLLNRPEIDPTQVGLLGHSQGGYVVPIAAGRGRDLIAFSILMAGPAVPVKEQIMDDMVSSWRCGGEPAWLIALKGAALRGGLGALDLVSSVVKPGYLARIVRHDPVDYISAVSQPMLVLLAENDRLVPAEKNAQVWRSAARRATGPTIIRIIPGAIHSFRPAGPCDEARSAPAYFADRLALGLSDEDFWSAVRRERSE